MIIKKRISLILKSLILFGNEEQEGIISAIVKKDTLPATVNLTLKELLFVNTVIDQYTDYEFPEDITPVDKYEVIMENDLYNTVYKEANEDIRLFKKMFNEGIEVELSKYNSIVAIIDRIFDNVPKADEMQTILGNAQAKVKELSPERLRTMADAIDGGTKGKRGRPKKVSDA